MKNVRLLAKENYHLEEDSEGTWAISYGDMITLLLTFFVIFFSTDFEREKVDKLNRHMSFQLENTVPVESSGEAIGGAEKVAVPAFDGYSMKAHQVGENVIVTFYGKSFFSSGEIKPNQNGSNILNAFAQKYLPYAGNYRVSVKAFTDIRQVNKNVKRHRQFTDNLELSALRAVSTMRVLQKAGIPLNRMEIAGAGELEQIEKVIPHAEGLTKKELESYSRTVVFVISPLKESWL